jgi:hypothetical protein
LKLFKSKLLVFHLVVSESLRYYKHTLYKHFSNQKHVYVSNCFIFNFVNEIFVNIDYRLMIRLSCFKNLHNRLFFI